MRKEFVPITLHFFQAIVLHLFSTKRNRYIALLTIQLSCTSGSQDSTSDRNSHHRCKEKSRVCEQFAVWNFVHFKH